MMKLRPCDCGLVYYTRVRRTWWMRLTGARRWLYRCGQCEARMLLPLDAILDKGGRPALGSQPAHLRA